MTGRLIRAVRLAALLAVTTVVSIAVALWVTPSQEVTAAGQTVEVGVAAPTWSLSGPAELDLFGQTVPSRISFVGPVRPRLQLTHITLSQQLTDFGRRARGGAAGRHLEDALVSGFRHYVYWQVGVVALVAVFVSGAVCGWLRWGRRRTVALVAGALVLAEAVNLGAVLVTAYTAPSRLRSVGSLQDLVGDAPPLRLPATPGKPSADGSVVVLGDSTAAGLGNEPVIGPSAGDTACARSRDTYAAYLQSTLSVKVTNLACSGATVEQGLLGPQTRGTLVLPPQLESAAVADASTIIVSVGANDVRWSDLLLVCAVSPSCEDNAEQAAFQQYLAEFSRNYLRLISSLQLLPHHPRVLINLYYDPFGGRTDCLVPLGVTDAKRAAMSSKLAALNHVLSAGAGAASFRTAHPDFDGHGLCSSVPWVQGVDATAPFHPTPGGELAIALADVHALQQPVGQDGG